VELSAYSLRPHAEEPRISAVARVFDALWRGASKHEAAPPSRRGPSDRSSDEAERGFVTPPRLLPVRLDAAVDQRTWASIAGWLRPFRLAMSCTSLSARSMFGAPFCKARAADAGRTSDCAAAAYFSYAPDRPDWRRA